MSTFSLSCVALAGGVVVASAAHAEDPPGNNGVVKIVGHGDIDSIPQNAPHPGCRFGIEWYGFDKGEIFSKVTLALHSPTTDGTLDVSGPAEVNVGADRAGGGTDLDGREWYSMTVGGGTPHPKQGYHIKLTVHTDGSIGDDTKHKVFWVEPCARTAPPVAGATGEVGTSEAPTGEVPTMVNSGL